MDNLRYNFLRTLIQFLFREIGNRMRHGQEFIIRKAPGLGHRLTRLSETIRNNGGRRYAMFLQENPVEHTARTARSSISNASNSDITLGSKLLDYVLIDR